MLTKVTVTLIRLNKLIRVTCESDVVTLRQVLSHPESMKLYRDTSAPGGILGAYSLSQLGQINITPPRIVSLDSQINDGEVIAFADKISSGDE